MTLTFNNVSKRSNVKKMLNFTLRQFFVASNKVSAAPLIFHKFLQECLKIYTLNVPIGYFIVLGPRTRYLVIEVQANFQKSVHWTIIQVSPLFLFQTLVLSLNHHKKKNFK